MNAPLQLDLQVGELGLPLSPRHVALAERLQLLVHDPCLAFEAHDDGQARLLARDFANFFAREKLVEAIDPPDFVALCLIREALAWANPLADAVFALQALGSMPLVLSPPSRWRDRVLQGIARGDTIMGFAMTETAAGSDVANLATRAIEVDQGFHVQGEKTLISNAGVADIYVVFATTSPEKKSRGISCFAVPADRVGVNLLRLQILSAPHPLGEMSFDCMVPTDALIGERDRGFALGMASLDRLRPTVAAAACGMGRRAFDEAMNHVKARHSFGQPLASAPIVQADLAKMALELHAARLLTYRAAQTCAQNGPNLTLHAAMAKAYATEAAQHIVDRAVQLHGGRGCLAESRVDLLYRSVRALRIYEGATEIQHLVIARQLLRD